MAETIIPLAIGPVVIVFSIGRKALASKIADRYKGYIRRPEVSGRGLRMACSFSKNRLSSNERISVVRMKSGGWHARRYDLDCSWDDALGKAVLWPSLYSFDACLRVLCATQIMRNKGLLLHSSGIVFRDRAFIFAGPSGSGKTTVARLSSPKRILSDEIIALAIDDKKRVLASSTPFWGEMGTGPASKKSYPVHALCFLEKGDRFQKLTIRKEDAVQKLLRCVCFFSHAAGESERALDLCLEIIVGTAAYVLSFEKKPLRWECLLEREPGTAWIPVKKRC